MSIIYHDTTFPRSSRDNCLRHPDPLQGPYRQQSAFTSAGHRAVLIVCLVGMVGVIGALVMGWL